MPEARRSWRGQSPDLTRQIHQTSQLIRETVSFLATIGREYGQASRTRPSKMKDVRHMPPKRKSLIGRIMERGAIAR
jgi:hypothetical protein